MSVLQIQILIQLLFMLLAIKADYLQDDFLLLEETFPINVDKCCPLNSVFNLEDKKCMLSRLPYKELQKYHLNYGNNYEL